MMSATTADRFDTYPRFNTRHLMGALVLLDLLLVLPLFGIGPTSWQQGAETAGTPVATTPVPRAVQAPPPSGPPATPAETTSAAPEPAAPNTRAPAQPAPALASERPAVAAAHQAPAAPTAADAPPDAVVHFGFDSDNLRAESRRRLAPIVAFLRSHADARVQISGYHGAGGNRIYNEDLAERRARAVREALQRAGIERNRIIIAKPARTTGSGKPEEAQRAEVTIVH